MNQKPIYAISKSESQINRILSNLVGADSSSCDICVLPPGRSLTGQPAFAGETKVPEGVIVCAVVGGLIGAAIGLLAASWTFTIPGMSQIIAAGSGIGALAAWVASVSVARIAGRRTRWGVSSLEAGCHQNRIPEGNFLISIRAGNRKDEFRVRKILTEGGVEEIPWL